ncbi:hypothetical protein [Poritiphilus flavus]|uniref:Curli production assembly/transport component CsgG n=1 Tax=Poritiphilus flavus TaxID=2697053 RepID=A0A6L9EHR7_9FLAO|nr:hypothetical protein [Poritiphilus flavus]NAS14324.1 hypothetical protein [Poritiphilus flavus]
MNLTTMKKYLILLLICTGLSYGQHSTIGIQSTRALNLENAVEAELVCQKIKEVILSTGTYEILDREALGLVMDEQNIQKKITSINADVVAQGRIKGAEFIIASKLFNVAYKKIKPSIFEKPIESVLGSDEDKDSEVGLQRAVFSFSVDILDTETGATLNTQKFSIGTVSDNLGGITKPEAFQSALKAKSLEGKLSQFLNESGGGAIKLISIEEEKGGSAAIVLINSGSSTDTKKNKKFKVYEISVLQIDGEDTIREKWVADLKVTAVEGEKLSTAKVDKGGQKLKELFESGAKLICKSK